MKFKAESHKLLKSFNIKVLFILVVALLTISACEQNKYKAGVQLYSQRRYAAAIEQIDDYIHNANNGAFVTRAELVRSSCYYELGLAAMEKENWSLSIRLFKLANSEQADAELAKVYRKLALDAIAENDVPKAMSYFSLILNETTNSDLVPEILQMRIVEEIDYYGDKKTAWNDYMFLYDLYPDNEYEVKARPYIERFITSNIDEAVEKALKKDYNSALEELFQIQRYPVGDKDRLNLEISNIYQEQAENEILNRDYFEANRLFLKALEYYPAKKDEINKRLTDVAYLYIEKGNDFLKVRDFDNALLYYQKSYEIIPDFDQANQAIANLHKIENNIKKASELSQQALMMEFERNYAEARRLFSQAYQLDNLKEYNDKAIVMSNLIEAEKDPVGFAQSIINSYKGGLLYRRIQAQKQQLLKKYTVEEIKDTGWKILLSTGQYKYEARYDLLTPAENLYFIWQVNLRDRSIIPLNKISEKIMD